MTWIIAILLGLILVALVSSNQLAAAGVWKVVRFAVIGSLLLFAWGMIVAFGVWYSETYYKGEWEKIFGIAITVLIPPIFAFFTRKFVANEYKKSKVGAFKWIAFVVLYVVAIMVTMVVVREVKDAYEYGGWLMVIVPLAFTGSILLLRSLLGTTSWREVWFGPPGVPEPRLVLSEERDAADAIEELAREKIDEQWDRLSEAQQSAAILELQKRSEATDLRLHALSVKLESEKTKRLKSEAWTVMGFFWLFAIFAAFGLIGIAWDIGFAYAMELKFVKGQSWLAGGVVIFAGVVIAGLIGSIWESIAESRAKKVVTE